MLAQPKDVLVYQTREGRLPFDEWLHKLDDQNAVARVLARIGRVRRGNLGDCKPVGQGVSELRVGYDRVTGFISGRKVCRWLSCSVGATSGRRVGILPWLSSTGPTTSSARRGEI
jgi:putative component of toxin-antitoxin plasmid stabilization module